MDNEEIEERRQRDDLCERIANNDLRLRDAARALGVTDQRMRVHVQNWRERHPGRSSAEILSQVLRGCCPNSNYYSVALKVTNLLVYFSHDERRRCASAHVELPG
jgi:hypothetical protein